MRDITVRQFESAYDGREVAAKALGVSRQTLFNWQNGVGTPKPGTIPDPWSYKARSLLEQIQAA